MPLADIDEHIAAAAAHLSRHQSEDGLWRDFETLAGASSDWVSAFICVAAKDCRALRDEVEVALTALVLRQRRNGGWSYNEQVPTDCDSTAWAMMALSTRVMWRPSAILRARRYLVSHADPSSGGFTTYGPADGIGRYIGVTDQEQTRGWLAAHPCVTSLALHAMLLHGEPRDSPLIRAAVAYLLRARDARGLWESYWWPGPAYNTYFALRALLMARAIVEPMLDEVLDVVAGDQSGSGGGTDGRSGPDGAFDTSLRALALLLAPYGARRDVCEAAVAWLLAAQGADGGWDSRPILRIPTPMTTAPDDAATWADIPGRGTGVIVRDQHGLFTTAAALWALSVARAVLRPKRSSGRGSRSYV
jgi:squalene-hopene/tetraprenyl-beta-curcumene cyclase